MATLRTVTASNWPKINPDDVADVEAIISEYDFDSKPELVVKVSIEDSEDSNPHLTVYGNNSFEVSKAVTDSDGNIVNREGGYTDEFLTRIAPYLEDKLVIETVGSEKCRFPLLAGQWVVWPDGSTEYNTFDHNPDRPANTDTESYVMVDPNCPICGSKRYESTSEEIPQRFDRHYVRVTCGNCRTWFKIEYRPIDVSWFDRLDGQHSAVSQEYLTPNRKDYYEQAEFPPYPSETLLEKLEWPLSCECCGEYLTGNHMVTAPDILKNYGISKQDPHQVAFQCPSCEEISVEAPQD